MHRERVHQVPTEVCITPGPGGGISRGKGHLLPACGDIYPIFHLFGRPIVEQ